MKEIYEWILNIIKSCNNQFHLDAADVLIELFNAKFADEEHTLLLRLLRQEKWLEIHHVIH